MLNKRNTVLSIKNQYNGNLTFEHLDLNRNFEVLIKGRRVAFKLNNQNGIDTISSLINLA